jgi:hypothetical protein
MARAVLRDIVFGLATTGLLMGCVEGGGKTGTGDSAGLAATPAKARAKAGQEIEAPEVFQATDSALWDGRPSLGGIWVASPDVENPERVVMFNPATGKSITGALFKRERENPGPRLQLSSDAAEALGILAGAPTEIRVTALRKEKVAEDAAAEVETAAADATAADTAAPDPAAKPAKDGDADAIASAALAAVESDKQDPSAKDADPAATVAAGTAAAAATAADGAAAVVDQTPKRKTWKERRAEAKAAREAKKKAAADAKAAAAAGTVVAAEGEAPTATPDAAAAAIAPIEAAPLDARTPEATAPVETKKKRKTVGDTAAAPAATAEVAAPEAPAAVGPARPIQVASFSKEDNAKRAAEALAKIGVTASPQKSDKDGKAVWGVVVMGDEVMLKKIKDAGFADAYFLK